MIADSFTIKQMGERAILVDFKPEISENILENILFIKEILEFGILEQKVEVINTYHSLLIIYPLTIEDAYSEFLAVQRLIAGANIEKNLQTKIFNIPVCYDEEYGLDLEELEKEKGMTIDQIIELHVQPAYSVFFIGFLPGFLYLGGLKKELYFPRKKTPRMEVLKGAVGIGENQTGIYPKTSPGGWQIIGNSPVEIFNKKLDPPCQISAGDKIKFYPVSKTDFLRIKAEVESGNFQLKFENYER